MPTKKDGPRLKSKPVVVNNVHCVEYPAPQFPQTLQPGEQVASKDTKLTPSIFAKPYGVQEADHPSFAKGYIIVGTAQQCDGDAPVAIVADYDMAQKIAGILNDEHEKKFPTCAACAVFGAPTWQGDIDDNEGWYHYTARVHPFKEKYVLCARLNQKSFAQIETERAEQKVVASYGPEILQDLRRASEVMDRPVPTSPKANLFDLAVFIGRHLAAMHEFKTGRDRDKFIQEIREIQEDIRGWKWPEPKKVDVKQVPFKMDKDQVNFHLKCIAGRILTLVDAMVSNEVQNKAFKKYVKQEFREQFRRVFDAFCPSNQGCETSEPEELAVANAEF